MTELGMGGYHLVTEDGLFQFVVRRTLKEHVKYVDTSEYSYSR